jgi:hypothetical protein
MAEDRSTDGHWEERVRQGAEAFDFSTLIGGVSTRNQGADEENDAYEQTAVSRQVRPVEVAPGLAVTSGRPTELHPYKVVSPIAWLLAGVLSTAAVVGIAVAVIKLLPQDKPAAVGTQASATTPITPTRGNPEKGLPDSGLTPGDQDRSFATSAPPAEEVRTQVMRAYGLDPANRRYVLCQLIPEAFGGTNRPANLFPTTRWFVDLKRRLDLKLAALVAEGSLTEKQAIMEIKTNWITAVHGHYVRNYGHGNPNAARKTEENLKW